jgi:hypothetical protein
MNRQTKGFLNTNTEITRQLMRTARTLEAEWKQVLRGSVGTGAKEDRSSTGRVWAAGFHHFNNNNNNILLTAIGLSPGGSGHLTHIQNMRQARPVLVRRAFWNLWNLYLLNFQFFSGRGKPRILNQWIWEHDCILSYIVTIKNNNQLHTPHSRRKQNKKCCLIYCAMTPLLIRSAMLVTSYDHSRTQRQEFHSYSEVSWQLHSKTQYHSISTEYEINSLKYTTWKHFSVRVSRWSEGFEASTACPSDNVSMKREISMQYWCNDTDIGGEKWKTR